MGIFMVCCLLVIVRDFNIFSAFHRPTKNQTPLIVYAYAVLSFSVTCQFFESIGWPGSQVRKCCGGIQVLEASLDLPLDGAIAPNTVALEQEAGILVPEAPYHYFILVDGTCDVKHPA
jgi:hypothetical protein